MDIKLKNDTIIICPNEKKEELIKKFALSFEYSVKYINKTNLLSSLSFSYDNKAILYLMKEKGYGFDNANEILENINFLKKGTDKLDKLVDVQEELLQKGLLRKNDNYKELFKNKDVLIYGYSSLDKELKNILDNLDVNYLFIEENKNNIHDIVIFENMEDEIKYFFSSICKMILNGTDINDILLYTYPMEYDFLLRKYASIYKLPINFESNYYLIDSPIFKEFITLSNELSFDEALEIIKNKKDRFNTIKKIIDVCNDGLNASEDKDVQIELIKELSKSIRLKEDKYKNAINIVNSSYIGDKHVFLLGFSLGSYPIIKKDTDFLSDKEKEICGLNTSKDDNLINNEELVKFLFNNKNLHISFKERMRKDVYYESLLVKKLKMKKIYYSNDNIRYNLDLANIEVAEALDLQNDFGIDSEFVNAIDSTSFRYKEFDHLFKPSKLFENESGELKVSYSLIDDYIHCPFKYFIKRIVGADAFEETFKMKLGTLFHQVLEDSIKRDVKKEDYLDKINEMFVDPKEVFFINKLFDNIFDVIIKNKKFMEVSSFKIPYGEQNLFYRFDENTILYGKVDKIVLNENEKEIIVVDYKTGGTEFNKDYVQVGLSLQLPIYSLLISKNYPEYSQTGIYIQNVLEDDEDVDEIYKLKGISINHEDKLSRLEHALFQNSNYIKGLYLGQKGYKSNNGIVTKEEFDEVIETTFNILKENIEAIRKGHFPISPLYLNGEDQVCENCPLISVCFKKDKDHRYIKIKKEGK